MVEIKKSVVERKRVFSSETRLRLNADFQLIRTEGATAVGRYCVIRVLLPPPDGSRRVAFVISRHFSKRAVVRNRARRLFREQYRKLLPGLMDCWIEFRPRAYMLRDVKLQDVAPEIERLLKKLNAFKPASGSYEK